MAVAAEASAMEQEANVEIAQERQEQQQARQASEGHSLKAAMAYAQNTRANATTQALLAIA